jgi:hypothetical protein
MALNDLTPLAKCLQIAASRGRAIRLAREQAGAIAREDQADDESAFAATMREAADDRGDDEHIQTDPVLG